MSAEQLPIMQFRGRFWSRGAQVACILIMLPILLGVGRIKFSNCLQQ